MVRVDATNHQLVHLKPCENAAMKTAQSLLVQPQCVPAHFDINLLVDHKHTGMCRAHSSPPSLQFNCRATLVTTDISCCCLDRVLDRTHWLGTARIVVSKQTRTQRKGRAPPPHDHVIFFLNHCPRSVPNGPKNREMQQGRLTATRLMKQVQQNLKHKFW